MKQTQHQAQEIPQAEKASEAESMPREVLYQPALLFLSQAMSACRSALNGGSQSHQHNSETKDPVIHDKWHG